MLSRLFLFSAAVVSICAEKLVKYSLGQKGKIGNFWKLTYIEDGKNFQNW